MSSDLDTICTFELANLRFGMPVNMVQEVIRQQDVTDVPLSPNSISGLINLRGQIITVVDLNHILLPKEEITPREGRLFLVCAPRRTPMALMIDKVGDVLKIDSGKIERSPDNVQGLVRELIDGAYKTDDELILLFNARRAVGLILDDIKKTQRGHIFG
ncbi:MAG: chemotaxis protein CheW [Planctomycetota bacterium]|nr:chemotaxis protein CheW [Planctomycetota bacterium]